MSEILPINFSIRQSVICHNWSLKRNTKNTEYMITHAFQVHTLKKCCDIVRKKCLAIHNSIYDGAEAPERSDTGKKSLVAYMLSQSLFTLTGRMIKSHVFFPFCFSLQYSHVIIPVLEDAEIPQNLLIL